MLRRHVLGIIENRSRWFSSMGNQEKKREPLRTPIAQELQSQFGNTALVNKVIRSNPNLEESDIYFWKNIINTLAKFGFIPRDCFRIVNLCPSVLGCEEQLLENVINEWMVRSRLTTSDFKFLIVNRPEFLTLTVPAVKHRLSFLSTYCQSKESLMTLLFLCPNIMQDEWADVMKKIEFLNEEMVVYKSEVTTCRALTKSLEHIMMRFSILEKCGLYKRPNPYFYKQTHKERLKLKNPKLKDITDKSDYSFARKIAKISLEEYEVYANTFAEHNHNSYNDLTDSSDEGEE